MITWLRNQAVALGALTALLLSSTAALTQETRKTGSSAPLELLRHANSSITMDLYQQAGADAKRQAQAHVGSLFIVPKAS